MIQSFLEEQLRELERQNLRRQWSEVQSQQDRAIILNGSRVLNFCSNNYLGLANHPMMVQAAKRALQEFGFGSGASRLVCGHTKLHRQLEEDIARLKGAEDCLVFSTGYMANVGIISSLFNRDDVVFSDRLNHASIIDGILLSRATLKRYTHRDVEVLEKELHKAGKYGKRLIVTDSVFSMDGDCAPLKEITKLAKKYKAWVMVDEAHAFGVFGEKGSGLIEALGLKKEITIQMGTLSKAAGSFGAYCCGSKELIDFLKNKARSFIYTTAMPASTAAASIEAVRLIEDSYSLRQNLLVKAERLRREIKHLGFDTFHSQTSIIPINMGDEETAVAFSEHLLKEGIFLQAIRPPTVPKGTARLRLTLMATHTDEDIERLIKALEKVGRKLGVIEESK